MATELTDKEKQELEELIETLSNIRGRHTQLVSVLIPAKQNINLVVRQLEAEKSTAANIKSHQTRDAVSDALEAIIRKLKGTKQTPPNGLAIYAGNVSEKEGVQDIRTWVYEPPKPLNVRIYRCDQTFVIEPLREILQITEVYGLLVIDRQRATIGMLEGKQIKLIRNLTSGVPGKVRAGGQCLSPDTLIMKEDGEIIEIKEAHNPLLIISENFNKEKTEETPILAKWQNEKELYRITTCYPKIKIEASSEHTFFIRNENGIEEKTLSEIKEGDYLIMPEKINLEITKYQEINFSPLIKQEWNIKKVELPRIIDENFSKILGYYLGDGNYEIDRISFSEERKEVLEYYKNLIDDFFKVNSVMRFRDKKNYYQLRVGSRLISQLFRYIFKEKNKTLSQIIPAIILKSKDSVVASFISGFFDAEGYVSDNVVAAGFNNKKLAQQLQLVFLRLGIIVSLNEYDNRRNPYSKNIRYTLSINDTISLKKFREFIGFVAKEKKDKLDLLIKNRSNRNKVRQIVSNGRDIARIIRNSGLNTRQFNLPDFFNNKKQLNKELFKEKIIDKINDVELKRRLELFYLSNLIAVKINKIESIGINKTIDIETKNHNFIANCLVVHNSSQRFHRITEGLAKEFFRRVAESMKEVFFDVPNLKGILVGGPIPTKEEFLEHGDLVTKLKEKVIAVKDLGYTDEHGLKLLVESSEEEMSQQEMIKEKAIIMRFFEILGKNRNKAAYGEEKVKLAIERGAVDLLLISKKFIKENNLLAKEIEDSANEIGSSVVIVSVDNQDGEQFYNLTKGVGAILRFPIE